MAVTVAAATGISDQPESIGHERWKYADITGDASYPTGGYTLTPGQFGLTKILAVIVPNSNGYAVTYVRATGKLLVRGGAASSGTAFVEVANAVDLSALTFFAIVIGY